MAAHVNILFVAAFFLVVLAICTGKNDDNYRNKQIVSIIRCCEFCSVFSACMAMKIKEIITCLLFG